MAATFCDSRRSVKKKQLVFKRPIFKNVIMETEKTKKAAGYAAAELIKDGMTVGLGTGSTVFYFIERLSQKVLDGLSIRAVCSSIQTELLAKKGKIPLADIDCLTFLDITVDGADEIDTSKQMIKGGGGALLREKILASMSHEMVVIVDESKLCTHLGKQKLPVEVIPFAHAAVLHKITHLGVQAGYRMNKDGSYFITDNGNNIIDIHFPSAIEDPKSIDVLLKKIPGVVETGLFINLAGRVIVGFADGQVVIKP